ncbi:hypothetical protein BGP_4793 [Beggiatoa sp. PS]|nr:hypothetical protein BGP_4793 [Beggiatoa sp. PS]
MVFGIRCLVFKFVVLNIKSKRLFGFHSANSQILEMISPRFGTKFLIQTKKAQRINEGTPLVFVVNFKIISLHFGTKFRCTWTSIHIFS